MLTLYQTGWVRSSGAFWAAGRRRPGLVCLCVCVRVCVRVRACVCVIEEGRGGATD